MIESAQHKMRAKVVSFRTALSNYGTNLSPRMAFILAKLQFLRQWSLSQFYEKSTSYNIDVSSLIPQATTINRMLHDTEQLRRT